MHYQNIYNSKVLLNLSETIEYGNTNLNSLSTSKKSYRDYHILFLENSFI